MSGSQQSVQPSASIQYLGGLEPDGNKLIEQAVASFKIRTQFKEENDIVIHEVPRYDRDHKKHLLAHRYRVSIYLGDEKTDWPVKHDEFLTQTEVINFFENLAPLWNLLRNYRVKKAVDQKKRISHLNHIAKVSEQEIAKW